jgi:predicted GTPase
MHFKCALLAPRCEISQIQGELSSTIVSITDWQSAELPQNRKTLRKCGYSSLMNSKTKFQASQVSQLTERLAALQSWRYLHQAQIEAVRGLFKTLKISSVDSESTFTKLDSLVVRERVSIAFLGNIASGKSELINALFFTDTGRRLMPSGLGRTTACITELRFDRERQTGVRLLPIETRESEHTLAQLRSMPSEWRSFPFESDQMESVMRALAAISETKRVSLEQAVALGLHSSGVVKPGRTDEEQSLVDIPRWRYAIVNFPHGLLDAGLVVIDTPAVATMRSESEFVRERLPALDAAILVLDANEGATKTDVETWRDVLNSGKSPREQAIARSGKANEGMDTALSVNNQAKLIALNRIDEIDLGAEAQTNPTAFLRQLDSQVHAVAELLHADPMAVIAVSAKLGLLGRLTGEPDKSARSRLYQLERAISQSLPDSRQDRVSSVVADALMGLLGGVKENLNNEYVASLEKLKILSQLRQKNEVMLSQLISQAGAKQDKLDGLTKALRASKGLHTSICDEMSGMVHPTAIKLELDGFKTQMRPMSRAMQANLAMTKFFPHLNMRIGTLQSKVDELYNLFLEMRPKISRELLVTGVDGVVDIVPFPIARFHAELVNLRNEADLLLRHEDKRPDAVREKEFNTAVGDRVQKMFEIANRESQVWAKSLFSELEKPVEFARTQMMARVENIDKMNGAEIDLAESISSLQASMDAVKSRRKSLDDVFEGVTRQLRLTA